MPEGESTERKSAKIKVCGTKERERERERETLQTKPLFLHRETARSHLAITRGKRERVPAASRSSSGGGIKAF
jgi:hypothetical protein